MLEKKLSGGLLSALQNYDGNFQEDLVIGHPDIAGDSWDEEISDCEEEYPGTRFILSARYRRVQSRYDAHLYYVSRIGTALGKPQ